MKDHEPRGPRRTQSERRDIAQRNLLDSARRLVALRGVDRVSVADIGTHAGYSRGLVNHRFGSRSALLRRLALDSQRALETTVTRSPQPAPEALARLTEAYFTWLAASAEDAQAFFAMWGSSVPTESDLHPVFAEFDERFRDQTYELLRAGQAEGSIDPALDCRINAVLFVALLRGVGMQNTLALDQLDLDAARRAVVAWIDTLRTR